MDILSIGLGAILGAVVAAWVVSGRARVRLLERATEVARLEEACRHLEARAREREEVLRTSQREAGEQLRASFEALSADALRKNNRSFLQMTLQGVQQLFSFYCCKQIILTCVGPDRIKCDRIGSDLFFRTIGLYPGNGVSFIRQTDKGGPMNIRV